MQKQLITVLVLVGAAACGGDDNTPLGPDGAVVQPMPDAPVEPVTCTPATLRTDLTWYGTNRQDLTTWLSSKGCTSTGYDAANKPVALFDWDNTISKNDFGDAITFYLLAHDKVLQPPNQDWKQTSGFMTDAGAAALTAACGTTVAAGQPLPTSTNTACAAEILSMYIDNKTSTSAPTPGVAAFAGHNARQLEPTYAWTAQLMAGYTHAEAQAMATAAITPELAAAENAVLPSLGGHADLNGWLRIYDQTRDLIAVAQSHGYDVWIITASPQDVIAAFAPMVGIAVDHVIGIRSTTDANGKLTYKFEGCGTVADDTQALIPYVQGKRCWVNKIVFGDTTATAMQKRADGQRQVFGAGDSDTDIEFLRDSTYRLVINRQKTEIMCHGYYNALDGWRINPMFIQPKGMKSSPYACSTSCKDEAGASVPCRDDAGNVIPTQTDTIHN
jgi:phosphoserine phosphatase